jgi:hypothetical protein
MGRLHRHPETEMERLLQELEMQGVDTDVIEQFARRAVERGRLRKASASVPILD